ncbi:MAG: acetoacetate--CoA ligase, partial [Actinobacteria bacterium]|nr:acetoacetate--CoA ligase [Actinomycetota bacterium]
MSEPVFVPGEAPTRMAAFASRAGERAGRDLTAYDDLHAWSIADPDAFWSLVWDFFGVVGTRGEVAADPAVLPEARFFPGAGLNIVDTYLRPMPERDDADLPIVVQTGEIGEGIGVVASLTREELVERVAAAAAALRARGVAPGDRIALVLPVGI